MEKDSKTTKITILKFDPLKDREPSYTSYALPVHRVSVLDALIYVLENYDADISFRYGCGGLGADQRCGSCAILINRRPALACKEIILEDEVIIEPHPKFEVIKDLAIDFNRPKIEKVGNTSPEVVPVINVEKCRGCGICVDICPLQVYGMTKKGNRTIASVIDQGSCCGKSCYQCVIYCPQSAIELQPNQNRKRRQGGTL